MAPVGGSKAAQSKQHDWLQTHWSGFSRRTNRKWLVVDPGIKADTKWRSSRLSQSGSLNPSSRNSRVVAFLSLAAVPLPQPAPTRDALTFTSCSELPGAEHKHWREFVCQFTRERERKEPWLEWKSAPLFYPFIFLLFLGHWVLSAAGNIHV